MARGLAVTDEVGTVEGGAGGSVGLEGARGGKKVRDPGGEEERKRTWRALSPPGVTCQAGIGRELAMGTRHGGTARRSVSSATRRHGWTRRRQRQARGNANGMVGLQIAILHY